jgi:hypothetical protein
MFSSLPKMLGIFSIFDLAIPTTVGRVRFLWGMAVAAPQQNRLKACVAFVAMSQHPTGQGVAALTAGGRCLLHEYSGGSSG